MHEIFKKRHSVRSFQDKEVESKKLNEILEAAESAPSAGNLKAREIIVVKDPETKKKLAEAALGQNFVAEAPLVLIFFSVPSRSAKKYGPRGKNLYALQDATIAVSFSWLQAIVLDLSACWVGAFDEEKVKEILNTKEDWQPICIMPVGYEWKK
jgi:nitroreductase